MPSSAHHGNAHNSSVANCVTVCLSAPTNSTKQETPIQDEQDDEPQFPFYLQFESAQTGWHAEKSITPHVVEEDDKIPILQRCCILRV